MNDEEIYEDKTFERFVRVRNDGVHHVFIGCRFRDGFHADIGSFFTVTGCTSSGNFDLLRGGRPTDEEKDLSRVDTKADADR